MANPTGVTAGTAITETWGDAVVSRVVGIYASTSAAETDGRTEKGALVSLSSDGSLWIKRSTAAGDWARVHPWSSAEAFASSFTAPSTFTNYLTQTFALSPNFYKMNIHARATISIQSVTACRVLALVQISTNGGAAFGGGTIYEVNCAASDYRTLNVGHFLKGVTPTGSVQARVRLRSTVTNTTIPGGFIEAQLLADFT